ncbi:hypothetical protein GCM10017708_17220 [Arthrobacter citreus]
MELHFDSEAAPVMSSDMTGSPAVPLRSTDEIMSGPTFRWRIHGKQIPSRQRLQRRAAVWSPRATHKHDREAEKPWEAESIPEADGPATRELFLEAATRAPASGETKHPADDRVPATAETMNLVDAQAQATGGASRRGDKRGPTSAV